MALATPIKGTFQLLIANGYTAAGTVKARTKSYSSIVNLTSEVKTSFYNFSRLVARVLTETITSVRAVEVSELETE